jgi:allantoinase
VTALGSSESRQAACGTRRTIARTPPDPRLRRFLYDSDAYNDDLPYTLAYGLRRHVVMPYAFDTNDMQFQTTNRFRGASDFADYVLEAFEWLYREGLHAPKMMSIGLHLRVIGRPGRIGALERILFTMRAKDDVWIARRDEIARHWLARTPETK